jgi:Ca-activated chloride channel homolog
MMFRFAYPTLLALLAAVAALALLRLRRRASSLTYAQASELGRLAGGSARVLGRLPLVLRAAGLALLVLSAARPQLYNVSRDIQSAGVDIVLCLDTSGSMQALDFQLDRRPASRLAAVKRVVGDFIRKREMDRIGLVVFGVEAFTQAPLTLDKGLLLDLVERMQIGMAGDRTAIGTAIAVGGKRLKDLPAKARILILLTDGRHNAGDLSPQEAAEAVRALGVKIYTIGVGGRGPAPFPVRTLLGERLVYQEVDLDEDTLRKIAELGGGKYYRAADSAELAEIYHRIDQEEKTEVKVKEFFHFRELYAYFLIPALVLLLAELVLRSTLLRVIP